MYIKMLTIFMLLSLFSIKSYAGINEKQKTVIKSQLFLIQEGMVSHLDVFKKAKLFDSKGFFGMNEDKMTEDEFLKFLEKEIEFEEFLEEEVLYSEN